VVRHFGYWGPNMLLLHAMNKAHWDQVLNNECCLGPIKL